MSSRRSTSESSTSEAAMHSVRARTELEMRSSLERANIATLEAIPLNTKKAYDPKIRELRRWCDIKFSYEETELRYIVNGEKAHYFLNEAVSFSFFVI